ncbi:MAG: DUF3363 domain-containing protein [Pseudomonadota bacterium]
MNYRKDGQFQPHLGRIRSLGNAERARSYLSRVSRAISRAGHNGRSVARESDRRPVSPGRRRVIVKARFIKTPPASKVSLRKHLDYVSRDGAIREQDKGKLFARANDEVDRTRFAERADSDRHHFRFIVSPEDGRKMEDLKPFVRDLMHQMSNDLGTELDWVAAVHHNTEYPHAHIVVRGRRDDGRDLVIPREYISHGIRDRAADLVSLELGPETHLEREQKLHRDIDAERLTQNDRSLIRAADDSGIVDINRTPARYRTQNIARLRTLERMKLAQEQAPGKWQLDSHLGEKLQNLGERGDIIKVLNKVAAHRHGRRLDVDYWQKDPGRGARTIEGAVLKAGLDGEFHDRKYVIIDTLDGRITKALIDLDTDLSELITGSVVKLTSSSGSSKPSDRTIDEIAKANGGKYSPTLHQNADPRATPGYITAHIRRLEGLRKAGFVARHKDGSWSVPSDHLNHVVTYEHEQARTRPLWVEVLSSHSINDQVLDDGLTWLDKAEAQDEFAEGFGAEVFQAKLNRQKILHERGYLKSPSDPLSDAQRSVLKNRTIKHLSGQVACETGKLYRAQPNNGAVSGTYTQKLNTADGPYAVIEQRQSFTITRWRQVLERRRGLSVSGAIKAGKISWSFDKGIDKGLAL